MNEYVTGFECGTKRYSEKTGEKGKYIYNKGKGNSI